MNIIYGAIIAILCLLLGTQLHFIKEEEMLPEYKVGDIIFEDINPTDLTKSKIIRITFKKETPDQVVFDLTYNYIGTPEEIPDVSAWSNMKRWSFSRGKVRPGLNTVDIVARLSSDAYGAHITDMMTLTLKDKNTGYNDWLDKETINFKKIWIHCEESQACLQVFSELKSRKPNILRKYQANKLSNADGDKAAAGS